MRLIIIGCEFTGKTTLAAGLGRWLERNLGSCTTSFHDHFLPWAEGDTGPKGERVDVDAKLLQLGDPGVVDRYCRYVAHYHTHPAFYALPDHCVVNWYYADAVYGPLYYGFGGPGAEGDREQMTRSCEALVKEAAPDTVLVHLTARPDVVRQRLQAADPPRPYPPAQDVERVLERFAEEASRSLFTRRILLDTSEATPEATLEALLEQMERHWTPADRLRMLTARQAGAGGR